MSRLKTFVNIIGVYRNSGGFMQSWNAQTPAVLSTGATSTSLIRQYSESENKPTKKKTGARKGKTPSGKFDDPMETSAEELEPQGEKEPLERFPENKNPLTGEIGGPRGPEPTRYGDWERKGRVTDF